MVKKWVCAFWILFGYVLYGQADAVNVGTLPAEVNETSGLIFFNDKLITLNDSGNTPQLFEIDTAALAVTRIITIENAINVDWEDLTQDGDYIYIGDFGNNLGGRQDLAIYRIAKTDYIASDSVGAEMISFSYEDQADFNENQNSDWDAEAFMVLQDQLVLFTKQWQSGGTVAYGIPKTPGIHSATNLGSFPVEGLVTGATYNLFSGALFLIGYSQQLQPFVLRLDGLTDMFSFNGTEQKTILPVGFSQAEGITYTDEKTYFFSSERFTNSNPPITLEAGLYKFITADTSPGEENPEEPTEGENPEEEPEGEDPDGEAEKEELLIFINAGSKVMQYELNSESELFGRAIFDTAGRRLSLSHANSIDTNTIDLSILESSVYYLTFYLQGRTVSKAFFLN